MSKHLHKGTNPRFQVYDALTSAGNTQVTYDKSQSTTKKVVLTSKCIEKQLINLTVLIYDSVENEFISCDPQVLNSPDTEKTIKKMRKDPKM